MAGRGADLIGIGMMTAVGAGAGRTATSVRAGIARLAESPVHNRDFRPMVMATLPEDELPPLVPELDRLEGLTTRERRMLRLAGPALSESVADVPSVDEAPLLLAVPETPQGGRDAAGPALLERLSIQAEVRFAVGASTLFPNGRAGGMLALAEALRMIESGRARRVIVGGVDSHLDLRLLGALDAESRVLADGVMDGFAPGEGAAFLLLDAAGAARGGPPALARLAAVATGVERGHRYSDEPYRGDGLAETLQSLFAADGDATRVNTVLAGLNGESFGAKEWGTAFIRAREHFADDMRLEHPVDCFGDPGAALGPLLVGLAAIGIQKGYVAEPCLAWCSSDRAERGAALIRSVPR